MTSADSIAQNRSLAEHGYVDYDGTPFFNGLWKDAAYYPIDEMNTMEDYANWDDEAAKVMSRRRARLT